MGFLFCFCSSLILLQDSLLYLGPEDKLFNNCSGCETQIIEKNCPLQAYTALIYKPHTYAYTCCVVSCADYSREFRMFCETYSQIGKSLFLSSNEGVFNQWVAEGRKHY